MVCWYRRLSSHLLSPSFTSWSSLNRQPWTQNLAVHVRIAWLLQSAVFRVSTRIFHWLSILVCYLFHSLLQILLYGVLIAMHCLLYVESHETCRSSRRSSAAAWTILFPCKKWFYYTCCWFRLSYQRRSFCNPTTIYMDWKNFQEFRLNAYIMIMNKSCDENNRTEQIIARSNK